MLKVSPAYRCRAFRPQSQYVAAPVLEGIHLLGHDIGAFAYAPGEKLPVLKSWSIETLVSIKTTKSKGTVLNKPPVALLFR